MARREYNIPVHIHKNPKNPKPNPKANGIDYIEKEEELNATEYLEEMNLKKETEQKPSQMTEEFAEDVMQGLIEHQHEEPAQPIAGKDRRELILWLGVSIFVLIIFTVWFLGLRTNFQSISLKLNENEENTALNSFSENFSDSLEVIKTNINVFENIKDELETEQTKKDAVDKLKSKIEIEKDKEVNQLPLPAATSD